MSSARKTMRGVVVGLGVMGMHHARVLHGLEDAALVAVVDPDPVRREMVERTYHDVRAYETLGAALAEHELDFAGLAVPVELMPELSAEALAAGVNVLAEKPTAPTETAAAAMIADAEARGLALGVGHVERYNPAVAALKEKIDYGAIGRVVQMHARRLSPFPNRQGSQGVALDLATHDIDVMRFISGTEVTRVYAETAAPFGSHEDMLCATIRFDDDSTGLLEANWLTPTKVRQLSVLGEHGMFVVDYLTQDLMLYEHPTRGTEWDALAGMRGGGEGDMIRFALQRREPLRVQWEGFLDSIRTAVPVPVGGRDGLAALSTARAIRESGERNVPVVPSYRGHVSAHA